MNNPSNLAGWLTRIEMWFVGPLEPDVRHNMIVDLRAACTHSVMATLITFIPIVLRRSGASAEQIAYYFSITTLGLLTTNVSMWLMRRFGMRPIVQICWLLHFYRSVKIIKLTSKLQKAPQGAFLFDISHCLV